MKDHKGILLLAAIILFVYLIFGIWITVDLYQDARMERQKVWQTSKEECLKDQPKYYCNSLLGVDFDKAPKTF